jgi:hypothetical protein
MLLRLFSAGLVLAAVLATTGCGTCHHRGDCPPTVASAPPCCPPPAPCCPPASRCCPAAIAPTPP